MTPPYVPLKTIQLLSETSFSKIKNKNVIWGGTLKWDTLYIKKILKNDEANVQDFLRTTEEESAINGTYKYGRARVA